MLLLALFVACKGGGGPDDTDDTDDTDVVELDACARWETDRSYWNAAIWTGDPNTCDAGELDPSTSSVMMRGANLYRHLAGLPDLVENADKSEAAQQCALILEANDTFVHVPDPGAQCFTTEGGNATASSLIAPVGGVAAIDQHMAGARWGTDPFTLRERRFLLSPITDTIGVGSSPNWSCYHVIGGTGTGGPQWVAWPPAGEIPLGAYEQTTNGSVWSIQSDLIDFTHATVKVIDVATGYELPLGVGVMQPNAGSRYALAWEARGWEPASDEDTTYRVEIGGLAEPISYDVKVLACLD